MTVPTPEEVDAKIAEIRARPARREYVFAGRYRPPQPKTIPYGQISRRERDVVVLICEGLTNAEIARRLFISTETVKSHVLKTLPRVGARNRTHLAVLWTRGEIPVHSPE